VFQPFGPCASSHRLISARLALYFLDVRLSIFFVVSESMLRTDFNFQLIVTALVGLYHMAGISSPAVTSLPRYLPFARPSSLAYFIGGSLVLVFGSPGKG